jgi:hypothetical protein
MAAQAAAVPVVSGLAESDACYGAQRRRGQLAGEKGECVPLRTTINRSNLATDCALAWRRLHPCGGIGLRRGRRDTLSQKRAVDRERVLHRTGLVVLMGTRTAAKGKQHVQMPAMIVSVSPGMSRPQAVNRFRGHAPREVARAMSPGTATARSPARRENGCCGRTWPLCDASLNSHWTIKGCQCVQRS